MLRLLCATRAVARHGFGEKKAAPILRCLFATHVVMVPSMGDSITEGTLLSWEKSPGDAVEQDEVLAVIETDKVNVDVRAPYAGVLTEVFAALDEDVAVGANLLAIDTDATAGASAEAATPTALASTTSPSPAPTPVPSAVLKEIPVGSRVPSIRFLGKNGWAALRSGVVLTPASETPSIAAAAPLMMDFVQHSPGALDFWELPSGPLYGRPVISESEMNAVETGGAELVA